MFQRRPQGLNLTAAFESHLKEPFDDLATLASIEARRAWLAASTDLVGDVFETFDRPNLSELSVASTTASSPEAKARLLYLLASTVAPGRIVELGSAFGISGAYLVAGLHAGGGGDFATIEAAASRSRIAQETVGFVRAANVSVEFVIGRFDDHFRALDGARMVFIDGNHSAQPTRNYVDEAVRRGDGELMLVLDDIDGYSLEMDQMWSRLANDRRFSATGRWNDLGVLVRGPVPLGLSRWT